MEPDYKVAIIRGGEYQFYDRENEQITLGTISTKNQQWIWQLLYSPDISDRIQCDIEGRAIFLRDEAEEMDYELYLGQDNVLKKVIHRDPTGATNVYHFSQYQPRIQVHEDDLTLSYPGDVEIIDNRK